MVFACILILGALAALGMCLAFAVSYNLAGFALWGLKGSFLGLSGSAIGGLVYAVHSFFDTRESAQKSQDKLKLAEERNRFKLEMAKLKYQNKKR